VEGEPVKLKFILFGALAFTLAFSGFANAEEVKWKKLQSGLRAGVQKGRPEDVKKFLIPLVNVGSKKAVDIVINTLEKMPGMQDNIYWMLVSAITTISDPEGLETLGEVIVTRRNALARDLMFSLQTNRVLEVLPLYERVLLKGPQDLQKMAIEALVNISKDECVDTLLVAMKGVKDKLIREEVIEALKMLTGADCGTSLRDWKQYWEEAKSQGIPKPVSEDGDNSGFGDGFRTGLSRFRKEQAIGIESLGPMAALVITAHCANSTGRICFDHLENTLTQMKIKNTIVDRYDFEEKGYTIPKETIALFINCVQIHPHCVCPHCKPGKGKFNRLYP